MLSITFSTSGMGKPANYKNVMPRFQKEAGLLVLEAVRSLIGTNTIFTLSPEYARRKPRMRGFRRIPGKDSDQPLIFSGAGIFFALGATYKGNEITISVYPGAGFSSHGFDYAEFHQEQTDYLGKGLALVEDQLDKILLDIIVDEMGL